MSLVYPARSSRCLIVLRLYFCLLFFQSCKDSMPGFHVSCLNGFKGPELSRARAYTHTNNGPVRTSRDGVCLASECADTPLHFNFRVIIVTESMSVLCCSTVKDGQGRKGCLIKRNTNIFDGTCVMLKHTHNDVPYTVISFAHCTCYTSCGIRL